MVASMNNNVYETLTQARATLFDMQTSHNMKLVDAEFRLELDRVGMALEDGADELDRLAGEIKELGKQRFKGREFYREFHESRDEMQEKPSKF